jgi:hydroxypyruvate isomerase
MNNKKKHSAKIKRREFMVGATLSAATLSLSSFIGPGKLNAKAEKDSKKFKLHYAPHFGMYKHHAGEDLIDQLKFMADQGFSALEDNGMMERPLEVQNQIAKEMSRLGMIMGVFVAYADFQNATFVHNKKETRDMLVEKMKAAVEVAKRVNAKWCTVVPGTFDSGLEWDYQTANVIDNLKWCVEVCEPAGLVMVLEPLNPWRDHPGLFLTKIPQAFQICRAVDSPSCKILDDMYHQQITEGNLIPNIDMAWNEIAYFQVGDNPGRDEPTTGEINYLNIFKHIHSKGYKGIIGMEHGNSMPGKKGEIAVIEAYRYCDGF